MGGRAVNTPIRTIIFFDLDAIPAAEVRCYDRASDPNQRWRAVMHDAREKSPWFGSMAEAVEYVVQKMGEQ